MRPFAGAPALGRARRGQQLQREQFEHQLDEQHLGVANLDDAQQRFEGVWRVVCGRHSDLLFRAEPSRAEARLAIGCAPQAASQSCSGREFGLKRSQRHAPVDAFEQPGVLRWRQRHAAQCCLWEDEATALQAPGQQQQALAAGSQQLEDVAASAAQDEAVAAERVGHQIRCARQRHRPCRAAGVGRCRFRSQWFPSERTQVPTMVAAAGPLATASRASP